VLPHVDSQIRRNAEKRYGHGVRPFVVFGRLPPLEGFADWKFPDIHLSA
jgi:hypothetical protein